LAQGLGATHDMMLAQYEQHFAAAGIATLAFDYRKNRRLRRCIAPTSRRNEQCVDVAAALEYLKSRPEVDGGRIGLWGTSLGGMNVVRVAAARDDVAVAVVQCPIAHGPAAARRLGLLAALGLTPAIAEELLRVVLRRQAHDFDHFAIYHPPLVSGVLADQTAFLQEHFGVDA
jgi:acetyl esterase/lipase